MIYLVNYNTEGKLSKIFYFFDFAQIILTFLIKIFLEIFNYCTSGEVLLLLLILFIQAAKEHWPYGGENTIFNLFENNKLILNANYMINVRSCYKF